MNKSKLIKKLRKEIAEITAANFDNMESRDNANTRADQNFTRGDEWKEQCLKGDKKIEDLNSRLKQAMLECAELNGYINRVEIQDNAEHLKRHGVKTFYPDGAVSQEVRDLPLVQRQTRTNLTVGIDNSPLVGWGSTRRR